MGENRMCSLQSILLGLSMLLGVDGAQAAPSPAPKRIGFARCSGTGNIPATKARQPCF